MSKQKKANAEEMDIGWAMISLLKKWGYLEEGQPYSVKNLLPTIREFSHHRIYKYGKDLFSHVATLENMENKLTDKKMSPLRVMRKILNDTTYVNLGGLDDAKRYEFDCLANSLNCKFGIRILYDEAIGIDTNIEKIKTEFMSRLTKKSLDTHTN